MNDYIPQTGFVYAAPLPGDWLAGPVTTLPVLQADRDWRPYLPTFEPQAFKYFDTMACVSFSALNCLEIYAQRKYGETPNWSDRFTAKMSGTTSIGNTFSAVGESIRTQGMVLESEYPADPTWTAVSQYYSEVPQTLITEGKANAAANPTAYEWIQSDPDVLWEQLQYSPIQVAWFFGRPDADGTYPRYTERANHGITLVAGIEKKSWFLFESEPGAKNNIKQVAWNSLFWGAMRHTISLNQPSVPNMTKFEEGKMYQLVEGHGGAYLFTRGQLLTGPEDKVLFAWEVMHDGNTAGKTGRLLLVDLKGVKLFDMSRNPIPNPYE